MARSQSPATAKKAPAKKKTSTTGSVDARPQHHGKDPLSLGKRLYNKPNTSEAKTYATSKG